MKKKIVHTPYNEANNPGGLCQAEKKLGLNSTLEIFNTDTYFDKADFVWNMKKNFFLKEILRYPMMIKILIKYDIIHYNYGSFIAPKYINENGKLKLLKKFYNFFYVKLFYGIDLKIAFFLKKKYLLPFKAQIQE